MEYKGKVILDINTYNAMTDTINRYKMVEANRRLWGEHVTISPAVEPTEKSKLPIDQIIRYCESIDKLELSVRARNCLKRQGIEQIWQIYSYHYDYGLLSLRNLGKKAAMEIQNRLAAYGYEILDVGGENG